MLQELFALNYKRMARYFKARSAAKIITAVLFVAVFLFVAAGIYRFFFFSLRYINSYIFLKNAISLYSYELYFLFVGFLIWVSSTIFILFSLFRSKTYGLIISSPNYLSAPRYSLASAFTSSLWIYLFVMVPAVLAIATVFNVSMDGILVMLVASVLLLALIIYSTFVLIMVVAKLLYEAGGRFLTFGRLALSQVFLIIVGFFVAGSSISRLDLVQALNILDLERQQAAFDKLINNFQIFPSNFAAEAMIHAQLGEFKAALGATFGLLFWTALAILIFNLTLRWFLPIWQILSEGYHIADNKPVRSRKMRFGWMIDGQFGAIFYKEMAATFRNMRNAFWLLFLLLLWFSHIGVNILFQRNLHKYNYANPALTTLMTALQMAILCYFLAAMVLRFVFPTFSAEKNTAWIIATAPLSFGRLLWSKLVFYGGVFTVFATIIETMNTRVLHLPNIHRLVFLILTIVCCLFLCCVGLALGAMFPNFETDDPQLLSTSLPGLALVLIAVVYGALTSLVLYNFISGACGYSAVYIYSAASLLLGLLIMYMASRRVRGMEFIKTA